MGDIYDGLLGSVAKMLYPVLVPMIKDILSSVALAAIAISTPNTTIIIILTTIATILEILKLRYSLF
ncbi:MULTISPECIES: hypothetical protein [unclassified Nostoc]|uniref:hypothetical protein n=1 Tax=unclassified Nostoc TaxID=2593658 RepID=UPI002AD25ACC|nr:MULTISPECIES: hypothetical protein [unclassified Nostoc]MDZ8126314.1 hypothetical protein [Nostoc sp. CmiVER01]MDZ8228207.1 hypothetical protein [Nostoc sp. ChiVER01]